MKLRTVEKAEISEAFEGLLAEGILNPLSGDPAAKKHADPRNLLMPRKILAVEKQIPSISQLAAAAGNTRVHETSQVARHDPTPKKALNPDGSPHPGRSILRPRSALT